MFVEAAGIIAARGRVSNAAAVADSRQIDSHGMAARRLGCHHRRAEKDSALRWQTNKVAEKPFLSVLVLKFVDGIRHRAFLVSHLKATVNSAATTPPSRLPV